MRLSLGEIAGIGPKPSNSDAFWTTTPRRRRNTAKPRRILDHYGTRTATHHITATAEAATGPARSRTRAAQRPRTLPIVRLPVHASGARSGTPYSAGHSVQRNAGTAVRRRGACWWGLQHVGLPAPGAAHSSTGPP